MLYAVLCTFDLKGASSNDYENAYADLKRLGLDRIQVGTSGAQTVIPTTTVMGEFEGTTSRSVSDQLLAAVRRIFTTRQFKSEVFLFAANDWAWAAGTTT